MMHTRRLRIVIPTAAEYADICHGIRGAHAWAEDYPTEGDVVMAGIVLASGDFPSAEHPWGPLQVVFDETGLAVGGIGFKGPPDRDGVAEIGYGLAPSVRGQGLATEAVLAIVDFAAGIGLRAVTAETENDNRASERVLEKAGFVRSEVGDAGLQAWRLTLVG